MCRVNVVSVPSACAAEYSSRVVAVIDEHDEPAAQAPRRVAHPVDRAQVDLGAPSGLERDAESIQIRGERRRGRWPFDSDEARGMVLAGGHHIDLAQSVLAHHHLMHGHCVDELVGHEHAFEALGQRRGARGEPAAHLAERRALLAARRRARFDQMKPDAIVEGREVRLRGAQDVGRQTSVARAGFDEVVVAGGRWLVLRMSAISASCIARSSPKSGPTSTLVKKSPARPERWAARA